MRHLSLASKSNPLTEARFGLRLRTPTIPSASDPMTLLPLATNAIVGRMLFRIYHLLLHLCGVVVEGACVMVVVLVLSMVRGGWGRRFVVWANDD